MKKHISTFVFFIVILIVWQIVAYMELVNPRKLPPVTEVFSELSNGISSDGLLLAAGVSVSIILKGLIIGIILTFIMCALSISFRPVYDIYNTLIATFDTLPGIALLPLGFLWFTDYSMLITALMIHGVIWPMSRSVLDGYNSTPKIYTEIGENIGLNRWGLIKGVYLPSSFPFIISGLKTGWARAWRALISAEMIFGTVGSDLQGIGWFIFTERYKGNTAGIIASLFVILIIGVIVEYAIFAQLEKRTVRKWGMIR